MEADRQNNKVRIVVHHNEVPRQNDRPDVMAKEDDLADIGAVKVALAELDDNVCCVVRVVHENEESEGAIDPVAN